MKLTPYEQEMIHTVQQLAKNDMGITELAQQVLKISPEIAQQQIADARKFLNVKTNIGLVVKAHKLGLIE